MGLQGRMSIVSSDSACIGGKLLIIVNAMAGLLQKHIFPCPLKQYFICGRFNVWHQ